MMRKSLLATMILSVPSTVLAQGVYFHRAGKTLWVDAGGAAVKTVVEDHVFTPTALAIDHAGGKLYWNYPFAHSNLDGTDFQSSEPDVTPQVMAIDPQSGKAYVGEPGSDEAFIYRLNLDGTGLETLISRQANHTHFLGMAIDLVRGKLYWSENAYFGGSFQPDINAIYRSDFDGSNVEYLWELSSWADGKLAIDAAGGILYWNNNGQILRGSVSGGAPTLIYDSNYDITTLSFDTYSQKLYWVQPVEMQQFTNHYRHDIRRANVDGTSVEIVASYPVDVFYSLEGLAIDSQGRIFVTGAYAFMDVTYGWQGAIERLNSDGSGRTVLARQRFAGVEFFEADFEHGFLYTSSTYPATITKTPLNGSSTVFFNQSLRTNKDLFVDSPSSRVFWTEGTNDEQEDCGRTVLSNLTDGSFLNQNADGCYLDILKANSTTDKFYYVLLDAVREVSTYCCSSVTLATVGTTGGQHIAVDDADQMIYWAGNGELHRVPFGGVGDQIILSGLGGIPELLTLDLPRGKIYWVLDSVIQRANLDGSDLQTVASGLPSKPRQIAIDDTTEKLFWLVAEADQFTYKLQRSNLDGSNVNLVVSATHIVGFAVDPRPMLCTPTALYADITGLPNSVEFQDIAAVVDAFRGQPDIAPALCDLAPCDAMGERCLGDGVIDFQDIAQAVNAFKGVGCQ